MKYQIWNKSTNDLYDFESEDFIKGENRIDKNQYLVLTEENKILFFTDTRILNEHISNNINDKIIADINCSECKYLNLIVSWKMFNFYTFIEQRFIRN